MFVSPAKKILLSDLPGVKPTEYRNIHGSAAVKTDDGIKHQSLEDIKSKTKNISNTSASYLSNRYLKMKNKATMMNYSKSLPSYEDNFCSNLDNLSFKGKHPSNSESDIIDTETSLKIKDVINFEVNDSNKAAINDSIISKTVEKGKAHQRSGADGAIIHKFSLWGGSGGAGGNSNLSLALQPLPLQQQSLSLPVLPLQTSNMNYGSPRISGGVNSGLLGSSAISSVNAGGLLSTSSGDLSSKLTEKSADKIRNIPTLSISGLQGAIGNISSNSNENNVSSMSSLNDDQTVAGSSVSVGSARNKILSARSNLAAIAEEPHSSSLSSSVAIIVSSSENNSSNAASGVHNSVVNTALIGSSPSKPVKSTKVRARRRSLNKKAGTRRRSSNRSIDSIHTAQQHSEINHIVSCDVDTNNGDEEVTQGEVGSRESDDEYEDLDSDGSDNAELQLRLDHARMNEICVQGVALSPRMSQMLDEEYNSPRSAFTASMSSFGSSFSRSLRGKVGKARVGDDASPAKTSNGIHEILSPGFNKSRRRKDNLVVGSATSPSAESMESHNSSSSMETTFMSTAPAILIRHKDHLNDSKSRGSADDDADADAGLDAMQFYERSKSAPSTTESTSLPLYGSESLGGQKSSVVTKISPRQRIKAHSILKSRSGNLGLIQRERTGESHEGLENQELSLSPVMHVTAESVSLSSSPSGPYYMLLNDHGNASTLSDLNSQPLSARSLGTEATKSSQQNATSSSTPRLQSTSSRIPSITNTQFQSEIIKSSSNSKVPAASKSQQLKPISKTIPITQLDTIKNKIANSNQDFAIAMTKAAVVAPISIEKQRYESSSSSSAGLNNRSRSGSNVTSEQVVASTRETTGTGPVVLTPQLMHRHNRSNSFSGNSLTMLQPLRHPEDFSPSEVSEVSGNDDSQDIANSPGDAAMLSQVNTPKIRSKPTAVIDSVLSSSNEFALPPQEFTSSGKAVVNSATSVVSTTNHTLASSSTSVETTEARLKQQSALKNVRKQPNNQMSNSYTCEPVENCKDPPLRWKRGVEKVIGEGSFGKVYLGLNEITGEMIAVKQIYLNENNEKDMTELMREIQLIQYLDHPNIVKFLGTSRSVDRLFILLEYASGGSIANVINQFGPMNESLIRYEIA